MPVYEYVCDRCQGVAEVWRRIEQRNDPVTCLGCGGPMTLVLSRGSFRLAGYGWASDGYTAPKRTKEEGKAKP